jgi:excinuclease ABC subunit C
MFDIEENLKKLPDKPGVYLHKDKYGEVIYVGKAVSLRKRVRQYFYGRRDLKTAALASHITEFEYIVTKTEHEALLLENTLIKRYMPKYNVMLRDDKTYPYIKITLGEKWPRLLKTRILKNDGSKYFGPYADVGAVNRMIDLLNDVFRLKRCAIMDFPAVHRPCLNGHIDKCRCVCSGLVLHDEYMEDIHEIMRFLKGQSSGVVNYIRTHMEAAAEELDYETAAGWRDYLSAAKSVTEKQRVELLSSGSIDIVLASRTEGQACCPDEEGSPCLASPEVSSITVFFVRDGRLIGREVHHLDAGAGAEKAEIVSAFLSQYYVNQTVIPKEIILEEHIADESLIEEVLTEGGGRKVSIIVPERGKKRGLLKLAQNDVEESEKRLTERASQEREKKAQLRAEIISVFGDEIRSGRPLRLEAYDISNTAGVDTVGAMVVFEDGRPDKRSYRRFRVRSETQGDDYAAMQEVIYRRFKRAEAGDKGFAALPDALLIDGGLGHVNAVLQVTQALGVTIPVAGMVKDDRHRTRGIVYDGTETDLKDLPELYHLFGTIQEEVHRFVIEYHRGVRKSGAIRSRLDEIPGVGEKRRNALLLTFGSIDAIRKASEEDIAKVPGMNAKAAKAVKDFFLNDGTLKQ